LVGQVRPPQAIADIYLWQALAYASLGNEQRTTEALERAAMTIEAATPSNKPEWLPNVSMTTVQETIGCSYIRLGKARPAADEIARALKSRSGDTDYPSRMHKSMVLTWASQAYAMLKEPDHAVGLLQEAIPTVSTSKSVRGVQEIRKARAALRPWESEPFVRQLDGEMRTAGITV